MIDLFLDVWYNSPGGGGDVRRAAAVSRSERTSAASVGKHE